MNHPELDALSLEYRRDYGTACGNLNISDFVDNPLINCVTSIFSLSFYEKASDFPFGEIGVLRDDITHSFLVAQDTS